VLLVFCQYAASWDYVIVRLREVLLGGSEGNSSDVHLKDNGCLMELSLSGDIETHRAPGHDSPCERSCAGGNI